MGFLWVEYRLGLQLYLSDQLGREIPARITEVKDNTVIVDANHFLAGKNLTFKIKVVEIVENNCSSSSCGSCCGGHDDGGCGSGDGSCGSGCH